MVRGRPKITVPPCRFCNMSFKRVEHLRRHERIHTQEKPFLCGCGQGFSRKDLLMRHHRARHHALPPDATTVHASEMDMAGNQGSSEQHSSRVPLLVQDSEPTGQHAVLPSMSESALQPSPSTGRFPHDTSIGREFDSTYEFELLWNNSNDMTDFLPTTFFDTDHSLSDIWQTSNPCAINSMPVALPLDDGNNDSPTLSLQRPPSFTSLSSRLPPLEPDSLSSQNERLPHSELDSPTDLARCVDSKPGFPWNISAATYEKLSASIRSHTKVLPLGFVVPSKHTMSRYTEGYFRGFHEHFPFVHPPTMALDTLAPELLLAMIGMGAIFRVEKRKGYELYLASKSIVMHHLEQRSRMPVVGLANSSVSGVECGSEHEVDDHGPCSHGMQILQSLIILMSMATWAEAPAVRDALAMGSQLAMLTRELGLSQPDEIIGRCSWVDWIQREERRRTLFVSYILLNLTSITFDVPPLLANNEIRLSLPHCNTEWTKPSAGEWQRTRQAFGHTERQFLPTLAEMISGRDVHHEEPLSALGNYALINAMMQNIYFERQTTIGHTLHPDTVKKFESALQVWQRSWEATQETSLDPSSPSGPLGFNSAALLRLAYIRLNANIGPCRNLISQDPKAIAGCITGNAYPLFTRSCHVDRAILQCIHALSIPIRVGIPFVAYTQSVNESIQHPLCSFECAILLSRWLRIVSDAVHITGLDSLREDERKLLGMIASLVRETDMAHTLDRDDADGWCIRRMAATVVRLWAETFQGIHVLEIVRVIGATLSTVADILEETLGQ